MALNSLILILAANFYDFARVLIPVDLSSIILRLRQIENCSTDTY